MMLRDYTVVRSSKRKKLTITVERDRSVVVHAPAQVADSDIERIVLAKRQWIHAKVNDAQKYQSRCHPPGKELVNGESAPYLGKDYRVEVCETSTGRLEFSDRFLVPKSQKTRQRTALKEWYVLRAEKMIVARAEQRAKELGVKFVKAKITDSRYRWGSCTAKDTVTFNWRLIKAPLHVIDYVIVHELSHLVEANHSPDFWRIVRVSSPAMEKARTWLREHGQLLEEEL